MIGADFVFLEAADLLRSGQIDDALAALADTDSFVFDGICERTTRTIGRMMMREILELAENLAIEATSLIRDGLISDALRRIECFTHPKWPSLEACEEQYRKAMNQ